MQYVPNEKLYDRGAEVAGEIRPAGTIPAKKIAGRIFAELREIKDAHAQMAVFARTNKIPQDMEWLLDNWYIAEREGKVAAGSMRYAGKVRATKSGQAVITTLARELVLCGVGELDVERIGLFLDGVQSVLILEEKETVLLIPALKMSLVTVIRETCAQMGREGSDDRGKIMGGAFTSLRLISGMDTTEVLEGVSFLENTLRKDPAGVYANMEEATRSAYRRTVSRLAKKRGICDYEAAQQIVELSERGTDDLQRHVGYYIYTKPLGEAKKRRTGGLYIGFIVIAALVLTLLIAIGLNKPVLSLLLLLPISEIVKNVVDFFVTKNTRPAHICRMQLEDGVPPEGRTLCVISALLSGKDSGAAFAGDLEEYALANRDSGRGVVYGVLADYPESREAEVPGAGEWLDIARAEIEGLNKKYGGGFVLLIRERTYNKRDKRYMGWERKRGAILELMRLLRGKESGIRCEAGNMLALEGIQYVITLDSDTRLNVGAAREMIGAMLHPLNRAEFSGNRMISGTGLIQPRACVNLDAAGKTDFTRIFAGQGGIDPYGSAASDLYEDLFGEGTFTGKGIIDVDAYSACLDDAFMENRVLSHDLLEGCYLHASYMGDVELSDGYPAKVVSYYRRMHRWVRGDWQAAPWLFSRVRNAAGERVQNPLSPVGKWKIFDNLRRSMVPVFTMLALLFSLLFGGRGLLVAGLVAILSPLSSLLINSAEIIFRRDPGTRARYHSTIIAGFGGGLLQTMSLLVLLPYEGYTCLSAALTALYRMTISKRNMLAWVASAESERQTGNSPGFYIYKMMPAVIVGMAVILFSRFAPALAVGVVWALSPLYALSISRDRKNRPRISEADDLYLRRAAGEIWRYFEDLLVPEDHFLPPDNWQEQPAAGVAHRTSPTNIGLAMLSALAAIDLELTNREKALGYIENMLATSERLEKWNGHLLNWYDTKTLRPLRPSYVSTVDSGNLAGCLIVLRESLYELGQNDLAARADRLVRAMDFSILFDRSRKLFTIGYDLERDAATESWYDLMASEARQTSYIAIASGQVPARHWRKLGRALVSQDNYSGMASWTGTMFEYLMPNLIMPCYQNSLLYESLKFCLYVQKKQHTPWGMSESAFYAFDPDLNYSYKAHGVQRLALKRGLSKEIVISPYSTFLALPLGVRGSVANLQRMERMGATGRYGFYEAIDFTPNRQSGGQGEMVKTFMVHHLGMSLLSIVNTLCGGILQKRFLRDRSMAAYTELLQEKVPLGQVVLRKAPREVPDKPRRLSQGGYVRDFHGVDILSPACGVASNGAYSVVLTETGISRSMCSGIMLMRFRPDQSGGEMGMGFWLKLESGVKAMQAVPNYDEHAEYQAHFSGEESHITVKRPDIMTTIGVSVPADELGEVRRITVMNRGESTLPCELICYFEPVLARPADYFAHPAFSKLGIETSLSDGAVVIKRRSNGESPERYAAFACSQPMGIDTSREQTLGREGLFQSFGKTTGSTLGTVLDPCVMARVHLNLKPGESRQILFTLALGEKAEDAVLSARRLLGNPEGNGYVDAWAAKLGMKSDEIAFAMSLVTDLLFHTDARRDSAKSILETGGAQSKLWPFGISGDLPIATMHAAGEAELTDAAMMIRVKALLNRCGVAFDLVILTYDSGDYRRPIYQGIKDLLAAGGMEGFLGARGGIHLADGNADIAPILAASCRIIPPAAKLTEPERHIDAPEGMKARPGRRMGGAPSWRYDPDGSFVFETGAGLPQSTWSNMLANETFGFVATDAGTGHMWHLNARENKITPWLNDSLATEGAERLYLERGGRRISLFAAPDGFDTTVTYGFGFARWEKKIDETPICLTAFVPHDLAARILILEGDFQADDKVGYFAELVMGPDDRNRPYVVTSYENGVLSAQNGSNTDFPGETFSLLASQQARGFTCDRRAYMMGREDGAAGAGFDPCFAVTWPAEKRLILVTGCEPADVLSSLCGLETAREKLEETKAWWQARVSVLHLDSPEENLNRYMNGWAVYQNLACRILGRTSIYQSGGAYGFRDQLQDTCAVIEALPELTKKQLLRAASHQYEEGDVQHWWHPSGLDDVPDKGVRTRCSDDLIWLPYVLCEYVEKTGERDVLELETAYLHSPPLSAGEHERYELPERSDLTETLYRHALRALTCALERGTGAHGLALVGTGDWNDGMNLVGAGGSGESVWLTWFLAHTLERFAPLMQSMGDDSGRFLASAGGLTKAAEQAWDGNWYLRGYYDSGDTLGSGKDDECRIDSIAQSFSTMAEGADPNRSKTALNAALQNLFDRDNKLAKLFTPAFERGEKNPGYIRGYAPGLRENGGQYTHAAVWLAMGCLRAGMIDEGWDILQALLPANHDLAIYRAEPYVIAADVYANPDHVGRGGWSWYTGAAGWYARVVTENLLGLRLRGGRLFIEPNLPSSWSGYRCRFKGYDIEVARGAGLEINVDGVPWNHEGLPLEEKLKIRSF